MSDSTLKKLGLAVLETESAAVDALKSRIDEDFVRACHYMLDCEGRVVVIGMGKSGQICRKIGSSLAILGRRHQAWRCRFLAFWTGQFAVE